MSSRKLNRAEWGSFCDRVSKGLVGKSAELEVVSLDFGDQIEARWLPLYGIAYDPKSDILEIVLEGVDHLISHPRDVYVEETMRGLVALEITTHDDTQQIVRLREPLALPAPTAAHGTSLPTGGAQ